MEKSEDNLVAWLTDRFARPIDPNCDADRTLIGIGDDMAMLPVAPRGLLVAADMLMDGVDFDSARHSPERIGRKALAVNLSDCAAMAVRPRSALVSLALPNGWSMEQAQGLFLGMEELAKRYDLRIVGGDTNSWNHPLVIDVTVIAEPWHGIAPVRRNGMKAGDLICVTGALGGSIERHHLDFEPRIEPARWLATAFGQGLHSMTDLSDGLSIDARHLCVASGCGMELREDSLERVASDAARAQAGRDGRAVTDHVLNDGEDFELLYAVDAIRYHHIERQEQKNPLNSRDADPVHRAIGEAVEEPGLWLKQKSGTRIPISPKGWRHFV